MAVVAKENTEQSSDLSWRDKLRAWWHGDDYVIQHEGEDHALAELPEAEPEPELPREVPTVES
jgi:hypothetical protein